MDDRRTKGLDFILAFLGEFDAQGVAKVVVGVDDGEGNGRDCKHVRFTPPGGATGDDARLDALLLKVGTELADGQADAVADIVGRREDDDAWGECVGVGVIVPAFDVGEQGRGGGGALLFVVGVRVLVVGVFGVVGAFFEVGWVVEVGCAVLFACVCVCVYVKCV